MGFLARWIVTSIAVVVAISFMPGISTYGNQLIAIGGVALFLALVNATIKPFIQLISLPVTFLSLGLFALVINAAMLELANALTQVFGSGLIISSFWSAIGASIVISIVSAFLGLFVGDKK